MNKTIIDIAVVIGALFAGGLVSVLDNPLTATFVFLLILGSWELAKYLPTLLNAKKEGPSKSIS
ncbi:MAG: hypothetical protein OEX19_01795 [Gammaproteobacteria bacterium]|nr:hypothetical protein [Gammaproteobacteria bacterium]